MINLRDVYDFFSEPFHILLRNPKKFQDELNRRPEILSKFNIPEQVADSTKIVHWDSWKNRGFSSPFDLIVENRSESFRQYIPEIEQLTEKQIIENWNCDIQDISGLSASKSDLTKFKNLDEFALSTTLISEITNESLNKNLLWEKGKILRNPYFHRYSWDNNRIHLSNSGGSHHFSAARYIASKLDKKIIVSGELISIKLVAESVHSLLNRFDLFAVSSYLEILISEQCRYFGAVVGFFNAPPPFTDKVIIFFPRNNKRSMRLSQLFKQSQLFDFGKFLFESLNKK